jgi:hypothetical protein
MKSPDERRAEERKFRGDVSYRVWRSGANPDLINGDTLLDKFHGGISADAVAHAEVNRQEQKRQQKRDEEQRQRERWEEEERQRMEEREREDADIEAELTKKAKTA